MSTAQGGPGNIVTSGLVLYLDAANYKSYTSGSTTWNDLSGNNKTGTFTNFGSQTIYDSANVGSIIFDGTNDYVQTPNLTELVGLNVVTYSAWVKWNGSGQNARIMTNEGQSTLTGLGILRRADNAYWLSPGASVPLIVSYSVPINIRSNWHMVTGVLTGTVGILYVNGIARNQASWSQTLNNSFFRIGNLTVASDPFNGQISNLQVYTRALSASEISQNFNATRARFGI